MTNEEVGLTTWYNNFTIANGSAVLTDGAKRDRLIWPGDMAIAVPAIVASYYDIQSIEDSLNSLYSLQNETTGQLPYAGIPFTERGLQSDTYHLYSLIGLADHFLYTGSLDYVEGKWDQFVAGLNYSLSTIDDSRLANISYSNDWLRVTQIHAPYDEKYTNNVHSMSHSHIRTLVFEKLRSETVLKPELFEE